MCFVSALQHVAPLLLPLCGLCSICARSSPLFLVLTESSISLKHLKMHFQLHNTQELETHEGAPASTCEPKAILWLCPTNENKTMHMAHELISTCPKNAQSYKKRKVLPLSHIQPGEIKVQPVEKHPNGVCLLLFVTSFVVESE